VETFIQQTQWVVDNQDKYNIKYVMHVGDVVEFGNDNNMWRNSKKAISILDENNIPYIIAVGNHDYDAKNIPINRSITAFNYFYGEKVKNNNQRSYTHEFVVNNQNYLIISLEYCPIELDWLIKTLDNNKDKKIFFISHSWYDLNVFQTNSCEIGAEIGGHSANEINEVLKRYDNIIFAAGGHFTDRGVYGTHMDKHLNIFINFQNYDLAGNIVLRQYNNIIFGAGGVSYNHSIHGNKLDKRLNIFFNLENKDFFGNITGFHFDSGYLGLVKIKDNEVDEIIIYSPRLDKYYD
jgi:hypothetical protein